MVGFFSGKARYYAKYRKRYPEEVFDTIISQLDLPFGGTILDLGCGTGNIAVPLAKRGMQVYAVDPEPEMIGEGKQFECDTSPIYPINWQIGADTTLSRMGLPRLQVCTMGLSFHWMNQYPLLCTLDTLIEPEGGIACVTRNDSFSLHPVHGNDWGNIVNSVVRDMMGDSWDYSGRTEIGRGERHETIFARSPFPIISEYVFPVCEELSIPDIIGLLLSHSYVNPILLGERNRELRERITERLLEIEPSGTFVDKTEVQLLIAKRD